MIRFFFILFFVVFCNANTCPAILDIPGDIRLGACNSTTLCENPCTGVLCTSSPSDCNIYTCIFGVCQVTGRKPGCCVVNNDCVDGNLCTTGVCISNVCNFVVGGAGKCQRDYDCTANLACLNCTCVAKPIIPCYNFTTNTTANCTTFCNLNSDCNDGNICTLDTCQPNNNCAFTLIGGCCIGDFQCQTNVTTCNRISRCMNNTCVTAPTDADMDGIPCPIDCNDFNPAIGGPTTYYADVDMDGYGSLIPVPSCTLTAGITSDSSDCNDANICVYPGNYKLCWDVNVGDCSATEPPRINNVSTINTCADSLSNSIFFSHQSLDDTGSDGYTGNQTIGLKTYPRQDVNIRFTIVQENNIANSELYLWSRDILSETTALRTDHLLDQINVTMDSIYENQDIFTAEATSMTDGSFIIAYAWYDQVDNVVTIKMANQTAFAPVTTFTIVSTSSLSGYVVFGRPSISLTVNYTILVIFQLYNPTLDLFAVSLVSNTTSVLASTTWGNITILSGLLYEPTPIIRLIFSKPSIVLAYGWNISGIVTPSFLYGVSVLATGEVPYAFSNVTFPLFVGEPYELEMIQLSDSRPMVIGKTLGPSTTTTTYYVTACLPNSPTNSLFSGWKCYPLEEGVGLSATLVQGHPFIAYWSTLQRVQSVNQAYAFDTSYIRLKYATSCFNIPAFGTWKIFGLPFSATFPSNVISPSTLTYLPSFLHRTAIMASTFSPNTTSTIAITSSNILGVEIDQ